MIDEFNGYKTDASLLNMVLDGQKVALDSNYADANGIEPFRSALFNQFGEALDDVIKSQGYRDVFIKRRAG